MEKDKINAAHVGLIFLAAVSATAILTVPRTSADYAGRDMWVSPIWATAVGVLSIYLAVRLNRIYPNQTVIEYCLPLLGKFLGKALGLAYLFFYIQSSSLLLKQYGLFLKSNFYTFTPMVVMVASLALLCAFNVHGGIEVIGKTAMLLVPAGLLMLFAILLSLVPDLKPERMLPVMEHGVFPSIMGSILIQGHFSEFFLIAFLLPYLKDRSKGMKIGIVTLCAVLCIFFFVNFFTLFILGDHVTANNVYPLLGLARGISIYGFLEHLESLFMFIWVIFIFIKLSLFLYVSTIGTAQWIGLSNYRSITFPLTFLVVVFSQWGLPRLQDVQHFVGTVAPFFLLTMHIALPLILLVVATVKGASADA